MTTPLAEVDLRVGGRYRIRMQEPDGASHTVTGVYLEVDPPRRVVYTWHWEEKLDRLPRQVRRPVLGSS